MKRTKYPFPREFQASVVRLALTDRPFMLAYRRALEPGYFTDALHRHIVQSALAVFDASRDFPTMGSVIVQATKDPPASMDETEIEARIRRFYKKGRPADAPYVIEKVVEFGRHQRIQSVLVSSSNYLDEGKYDALVDDMREANDLAAQGANHYNYIETVDERIDSWEERLKRYVPFGLKSIDAKLQGGGLGPGEMGVLVGTPGGFKTTTLCNIGHFARRRDQNVFHATFEVSRMKTALRYDCRRARMTWQDVQLNREHAKRRIRRFDEKHPGRLFIHWWGTRQCSMHDLEAHLRSLEARTGFRPDVLICDYVAKGKPVGQHKSEFTRFGIAEMYQDFRNLCGVLDVPGWTAMQANREGVKKQRDEEDVIDMDNAAEAFEPVREADIVLSLNTTREERRQGKMRVFAAKVRDEDAQWTVEVAVDAARYTLRDAED